MTDAVCLVGLSKRYGPRTVLDRLSLSVAPGNRLVLAGPSGVGKTCLLRLIAGLDTPDEGEVRLHRQPATRGRRILIPPHRRGIAMLFQDLALWPGLRVIENVLLGMANDRRPRAERRRDALDTLELCGVGHLADASPRRLSGGEQQRVALARVLAARPSILLLDEPFGGLDIAAKLAILQAVHARSVAEGVTVIAVSHQPADADCLHAEIAVLEDGLIAERGTPRALRAAPRSRTMQAWREVWAGARP
jgi:ABC-type Fe3+/spermidine/putrescine transport system ATPase subunit